MFFMRPKAESGLPMNDDLIRRTDPVDDLCEAIARLQMRPADAALIYRALCDYRATNTHTHIELMRVPGLAQLWTSLETACAAAAGRDKL
jgi:hypothetical protein